MIVADFSYKHAASPQNTWIDGLEWCGLLVDYGDVFSAVLGSYLTAPIYCRGSTGVQVMLAIFLQICFSEQTTWMWTNFQEMYIFGWTIQWSEAIATYI